MKNPFEWDSNSDQPYILKDKVYKKQMRKKNSDWFNLLRSNFIIFPLGILMSKIFKSEKKEIKHFFGMSVNLDKDKSQVELIRELNCKNILIRMPLRDIKNLNAYVEFAKKFDGCKILINILQDREHIEDRELLTKSLTKIYSSFKGIANEFQIGNAINRTKWGFFSVKEYLDFYQVAYDLKEKKFEEYKLVGPAVIDFEYHYTIRALFNKLNIYFDKVGALLYVDRRGAPENKQMLTFDTSKKISFLYALATLAKISSNKIVVTEVNWPISDTAPYAPTSENECVDEHTYAQFMLRYYLLSLGSQRVETVYWHQLIASGYGLIDARKGLRKREAFEVFKVMLKFIQESTFVDYKQTGDLFILTLEDKKRKKLDVLWCSSKRKIPLEDALEVYDMYGKKISNDVNISESPIYAYHK